MENLFKPPESFVLDGHIAENWKKFSQKFDVFMTASGLISKPEETQIAGLLNFIGDDGLDLHNTFPYSEEKAKLLEAIKKKV